ncbi:MAG: hypothetical protein V7607_6278 [Solirubrobacteraceae bacterium]
MEGSDPRTSLEERAGQIVEAAVVGVAGDILKYVALAVIALVALTVWQGGSIPAWVAVLAVIVVLAAAMLRGRRLRRRVTDAEDEAAILDYALSRHENYTSHVAEVLDNLQRVVAGDLDTSMGDYIERGILAPAREYLTTDATENVRLAIVTPREEDTSRWQMVLTAGHSLAGREKYHERIVDTLSRFAYESGSPQSWDDVTEERRFTPTPQATRPFRSMISLPIRSGDAILGVFNVISAEPYAFDPAEERYIASLGGVINVAVGILLKGPTEDADGSE